MEWAKFGANVGVQVVKMLSDSKRDAQLNETIRQRDVYKKEAECLRSHLQDVKRERYANGHNAQKSHTYNSKRDFNKGVPQKTKNETKTGGHNLHPVKKSYDSSRGSGQNNSTQNTYQKPSGTWSGPGVNNGKTNFNGSNFGANRGRGNSHSRGRGSWRGNSEFNIQVVTKQSISVKRK